MDIRVAVVGVVVALAGVAAPAEAAVIADSIAEFSGTQGQAGWFYGYVDPTAFAYGFTPMGEFDGVRWWVDSANYWTMLGMVGGHSNGTISSGPVLHEEQWAARRWVSTYDGVLDIDGVLRKLNVNPASNGVTGRIYMDGVEIWSQFISGTDGAGVLPHLQVDVDFGTMLDFVLDPTDSNDWSDNTQFSVKMTSVPAPGVGALAVVGVLAMGRRRRG